MIGLDTNILVRYLTQDDQQQWKQAAEVIQQNQPCFIAYIAVPGLMRYRDLEECEHLARYCQRARCLCLRTRYANALQKRTS